MAVCRVRRLRVFKVDAGFATGYVDEFDTNPYSRTQEPKMAFTAQELQDSGKIALDI